MFINTTIQAVPLLGYFCKKILFLLAQITLPWFLCELQDTFRIRQKHSTAQWAQERHASEWLSTAEHAREGSSAEQINEWAQRASGWATDQISIQDVLIHTALVKLNLRSILLICPFPDHLVRHGGDCFSVSLFFFRLLSCFFSFSHSLFLSFFPSFFLSVSPSIFCWSWVNFALGSLSEVTMQNKYICGVYGEKSDFAQLAKRWQHWNTLI